jgi:hypothetical protein
LSQRPGDLLRICLDKGHLIFDDRLQVDAAPVRRIAVGFDGQVGQAADIHTFLFESHFPA